MNFEQIKESFKSEKENQKSSISVIDQLDVKPIVYGIEKNLFKHDFSIIYNSPLQSGKFLLDGEVDLGIIPVTKYAQTKESWKVIPDLAISSTGKTKSVQLFFRKGLQDIHKIAVDERADTSFLVLQVLMREKFMMSPDYVRIKPDLKNMLSISDAALLVGTEALHEQEINKSSFDLGEEWFDFTGNPIVYTFCAGRQITGLEKEAERIKKSFNLGIRNLEKIARDAAEKSPYGWSFYHDYLSQNIKYTFGDKEKAGLNEFYNYAFFYGLIDYIPDLHFFDIS